jgi:hypothetical protein
MTASLGTVSCTTLVQGPISIVSCVPVELNCNDTGDLLAVPQWHHLTMGWVLSGCPPHVAEELTELAYPETWLVRSGRRDLRQEIEERLVAAADEALARWLAEGGRVERKESER